MARSTTAMLGLVTGSLVARPVFAQQDLPALIKRIGPSVVTIETVGSLGQPLGRGSGFFLTDATVVTNHHVIEGASAAKVRLSTGEEITVEGVVGQDPVHDVAVLALVKSSVSGRALALRPDLPSVGESVVVIGSPRGFDQTVTTGIVSAVREYEPFGQVIQTNAAISPGSSGGPLLDLEGRVIGVVCFTRTDAESLNFAIPVGRISSIPPTALQPLDRIIPELASTPEDVPEGILERLSTDDRRLVAEQARWFIRIPDGRYVNAYRPLRARWAADTLSGTARARELEALGIRKDGSPQYKVEYPAGLPPEHDTRDDVRVLSGVMGDEWIVVKDDRGDMAIATVHTSPVVHGQQWISAGGSETVVLRSDAGTLITDKVKSGASVLVRIGEFRDRGVVAPMFKHFSASDLAATPAGLAFAAAGGKAQLVVHSYSRSSTSGTTTESPGAESWGLGGSKTKHGPSTVSYRWKSVPVEIELRQPVATSAPVPTNPPARVLHDEPIRSPDRLYMVDGRVLKGRLVTQSKDTVVFVVVSGRIQSEMTFRPGEVRSVERDVEPGK